MSIKQKIIFAAENTGTNESFSGVAETTTGINFEADQQDAMKKTTNIHSLADQVEALEFVNRNIEGAEKNLKDLKKTIT